MQTPNESEPYYEIVNVNNHRRPAPEPLFKSLTMAQHLEQARLEPIPKHLFDEFWIERELCILFSDTGKGKSILAFQIADSISKGIPIDGFKMDVEPQKVLYFDFELSRKQVEKRYSDNYQNHYSFSDNFIRAERNPYSNIPESFPDYETYITHSLEEEIKKTQAEVLIIDNITYLNNETDKARNAQPLIKHLNLLKEKYNLSLLVLAHTPKRNLSSPITENDLQGSKSLMNFTDSSFAIGESHQDANIRYLTQIKVRNAERLYHTDNVCICNVEKESNFLKFNFLHFDSERNHLKERKESEGTKWESQVKEILQANPQISSYAIAKQLCPTDRQLNSFKVTIRRIVNRLQSGSNELGSNSNMME